MFFVRTVEVLKLGRFFLRALELLLVDVHVLSERLDILTLCLRCVTTCIPFQLPDDVV